jgi:hypothetical protein
LPKGFGISRGRGKWREGKTDFRRIEIKVFNLEPSDWCSSAGALAEVSETVLAGVDVAGGEDDVEAIVPFVFSSFSKVGFEIRGKMDGTCAW